MNERHASSNFWWRCTAAIFRWLLGLYPRQFRETYSSQMVQDFRDLWEEAALRSGAIGVCRLCWDTFGDLVTTAIAERLGKDQAVGRSIVVRGSAVVIWVTAVYAALDVQTANLSDLPLPIEVRLFLAWGELAFNVAFLVGLVALQLKYRKRTPWYIWLIGSGTVLAFFCWRLLPRLLDQGVILILGDEGLFHITSIGMQTYPIFFAIYLLYSVSLIVWGLSTLVKGVLLPWTAVLLILLGLESLLLRTFFPIVSYGPIPYGFDIPIVPTLVYGTPYGLIRCVLLAGLRYAVWVNNRPGRAPSEQNGRVRHHSDLQKA